MAHVPEWIFQITFSLAVTETPYCSMCSQTTTVVQLKIFCQYDGCNLVFHLGFNLFLPDHQWNLLHIWMFIHINSFSSSKIPIMYVCCLFFLTSHFDDCILSTLFLILSLVVSISFISPSNVFYFSNIFIFLFFLSELCHIIFIFFFETYFSFYELF